MLVGHEKQVSSFKKMYENDKVPHAFLLIGQEGVGKKDFAHYASCLLRNIEEKNIEHNPDIIHLESPNIADVRALNKLIIKPSFSGGTRIVIIDNAQNIMVQSANALLKTIEEPKSETIFFFLSVLAEQMIPTIRSRCVHFYFSFVDTSTIEKSIDTSSIEDLKVLWEGLPSYANKICKDIKAKEEAIEIIDDSKTFLSDDMSKSFNIIEKYVKDKNLFEKFIYSTIYTERKTRNNLDIIRLLMKILTSIKKSNANIPYMMHNFIIQTQK